MIARWCYLFIALLLPGASAFSTPPKSGIVRSFHKKASTTSQVHETILRSLAPHHEEALCDDIKEEEEDQIRQILVGKHKWLGGAISDSGTIYGIPSHSNYVICLSPSTTQDDDNESDSDSSYQINMLRLPSYITNNAKRDGGKHKDHHFKWLRGIISNESLYGIPAWSKDGVLKVNIHEWSKWREANPSRRIIDGDDDLSNTLVTTIPFPDADDEQQKHYRWAWHGAALNTNSTAIYCIPSNAQHVLKVDLETSTTSYLSIPPLPHMEPAHHSKLLSGSNKWYGGILGNDNCVYGIPYAAGSVLCIDANTDEVSLLGDFGWNKYNFHGGIKSSKGAIYAFPAHADKVLKIDTTITNGDDGEKLSLLSIQRAPYDNDPVTRYKWLGGSIGKDGNIFGMPSDASSVLHINVMNDVVTTFGCIEDSDPDRVNADGSKYIEKNKFQGGVLGRDGFIYALPSNAKGILRIDTRPVSDKEGGSIFLDKNRVSCIGSLEQKTDKYQGGFAVKSGEIIAIPENCNSVLKVLPPCLDDADTCIEEGLADGGVEISTLY
ncbi:hypothetical protein QTG54_002387 [Skeletonema marinoi]|uniref:Uncharacterized protein n=1 Tax=Skeletonema marinoi TaxID=267567 RepID=A0AAD9DIR0_9STRA|nr:hypothetical protein QTG54_002387 [Skeletonema marinoi]